MLRGELIGLKSRDREENREGGEQRRAYVCEEPESLADCCYQPAHFLEQSKQPIKEMGQQE